MSEKTIAGVTILTSELLDTHPKLRHGFSTRLGGVSEGDFATLNLGRSGLDSRENILENFRRFGVAVGFEPQNLIFAKQIHSDIVRVVTAEHRGDGLFRPAPLECDAHVTNDSEVALTVFSADCTPILLYDPVRHAIGAVHSGWRGTAAGIVAKTVDVMSREYGTRPGDLLAAIGPCIGPCCFETTAEVPEAMRAALGGAVDVTVVDDGGGHFHVDLVKINRIWLENAGVTQIDALNVCTACDLDRFWSHRKLGENRGSLAAVIQLTKSGAVRVGG